MLYHQLYYFRNIDLILVPALVYMHYLYNQNKSDMDQIYLNLIRNLQPMMIYLCLKYLINYY